MRYKASRSPDYHSIIDELRAQSSFQHAMENQALSEIFKNYQSQVAREQARVSPILSDESVRKALLNNMILSSNAEYAPKLNLSKLQGLNALTNLRNQNTLRSMYQGEQERLKLQSLPKSLQEEAKAAWLKNYILSSDAEYAPQLNRNKLSKSFFESENQRLKSEQEQLQLQNLPKSLEEKALAEHLKNIALASDAEYAPKLNLSKLKGLDANAARIGYQGDQERLKLQSLPKSLEEKALSEHLKNIALQSDAEFAPKLNLSKLLGLDALVDVRKNNAERLGYQSEQEKLILNNLPESLRSKLLDAYAATELKKQNLSNAKIAGEKANLELQYLPRSLQNKQANIESATNLNMQRLANEKNRPLVGGQDAASKVMEKAPEMAKIRHSIKEIENYGINPASGQPFSNEEKSNTIMQLRQQLDDISLKDKRTSRELLQAAKQLLPEMAQVNMAVVSQYAGPKGKAKLAKDSLRAITTGRTPESLVEYKKYKDIQVALTQKIMTRGFDDSVQKYAVQSLKKMINTLDGITNPELATKKWNEIKRIMGVEVNAIIDSLPSDGYEREYFTKIGVYRPVVIKDYYGDGGNSTKTQNKKYVPTPEEARSELIRRKAMKEQGAAYG